MREPVATTRDVSRVYRSASGPVHAIEHVDADIEPGEVTAIVGPSGSGKSTLLRIIGALDRPTEGTVHVDGLALNDLSKKARRDLRRRRLGFMFARPADNLVPYLTATEHLRLAAELRGTTTDDALLEQLGLGHRLDHRPMHLSGGEQQRLALATAVVGNPVLVLADEPTAELDRHSAQVLVDALHALASTGTTTVVATHDPVVFDAADHVIRMRRA